MKEKEREGSKEGWWNEIKGGRRRRGWWRSRSAGGETKSMHRGGMQRALRAAPSNTEPYVREHILPHFTTASLSFSLFLFNCVLLLLSLFRPSRRGYYYARTHAGVVVSARSNPSMCEVLAARCNSPSCISELTIENTFSKTRLLSRFSAEYISRFRLICHLCLSRYFCEVRFLYIKPITHRPKLSDRKLLHVRFKQCAISRHDFQSGTSFSLPA